MNIRRIAAVWAAKAAGFICKKMGRQGVTWAGKIALKIYPPVLRELASEVRRDIFVVCGTNGKTTTNNMLCAALEAEGQKVICNHTGSNMLNGVVAAFVLGAKLNGHMDADYACIEADEASTKYIFPEIRPDYMVMTNLFRDQLDRYGEIDITMNILETMIKTVPDMKVIVNGDDALSAYLAMDSGNPCVFYGISQPVMKNDTNEIREGRFCKKCGEKLQYSFYHYSQLGDYACPKCGFKRPEPDFDAEDVQVGDRLSFRVENRLISANYKGFYNVYNILAAYAGVRTAGFSAEHFTDMLKKFNPENGRMEQFRDPQSNTLAIVDYAHNYASVTALLDFVYERWGEENPRITLVTGSAGNKAYDRRKEIVEAAENRIANFIFTAEDTDTEPIIDICMEMQGYITNKDVVSTVISDRLTAITNAIYDARAHADRFNILLIIGKGNERWIKDHRKHVPFDGDDHVVERMFGL